MFLSKLFGQVNQEHKDNRRPMRTFTYFIPAPPARESSYQEKSFDDITKAVQEFGFLINDIKMESLTSDTVSGVYIILCLEPINQNARDIAMSQLLDTLNDNISQEQSHLEPEGLYYID